MKLYVLFGMLLMAFQSHSQYAVKITFQPKFEGKNVQSAWEAQDIIRILYSMVNSITEFPNQKWNQRGYSESKI